MFDVHALHFINLSSVFNVYYILICSNTECIKTQMARMENINDLKCHLLTITKTSSANFLLGGAGSDASPEIRLQ